MENGYDVVQASREEAVQINGAQQQETVSNGGAGGAGVAGGAGSMHDAKAQKMSRFVALAKNKISDLQSVIATRNATIESQETTLNQLKTQMAQVSQQLNERDDQVKALKDLATRAHAKINDLQDQMEQAAPAMNDEAPVRGRPTAVVHRIEHAGVTWCLALLEPQVDANNNNNNNISDSLSNDSSDDNQQQHQQQVEWMLENELFQRVESTELPFTLPSPDLSQYESDDLRLSANRAVADLVKLQDAYRRYRVRADVSRKQKESEIARLEQRMLNLQQNHIVTDDVQSELASLRKQVQTLSTGLARAETQSKTLERKATDATTQLRASQATSEQWQAKCEELILSSTTDSGFSMGIGGGRERGLSHSGSSLLGGSSMADGMSNSMSSTSLASNNNSSNNSSKLQREYDNYRQRALRIINDRDKELAELRSVVQSAQEGRANSNSKSKTAAASSAAAASARDSRTDEGGARNTSNDNSSAVKLDRRSSHASSSASLVSVGDQANGLDLPYLKCLLLKYMASSNENETREHMEAAIATVLRFTPAEIKSVHENRSSFFSSAFSLWS